MVRESDNKDDGEEPGQDQKPNESVRGIGPPSVLPVITLVKDTLPLIGFLLLPGFALRALVVADFDPAVAIALVQFTQPLSFLLTFLLDTLPLLMYTIGLIVLFGTGRSYRDGSLVGPFPAIGAYLLASLLSVPIFMTAPFPELPYYVLLSIPLLATSKAAKLPSLGKGRNLRSAKASEELHRHLGAWDTHFYARAYWPVVIFILVILAFLKDMWLAPEALTIRGELRTGYVLQQQDQDLVMYDQSLNAVLRVPKADVSYRQFCDLQNSTVAQRLLGSPQGRSACPK